MKFRSAFPKHNSSWHLVVNYKFSAWFEINDIGIHHFFSFDVSLTVLQHFSWNPVWPLSSCIHSFTTWSSQTVISCKASNFVRSFTAFRPFRRISHFTVGWNTNLSALLFYINALAGHWFQWLLSCLPSILISKFHFQTLFHSSFSSFYYIIIQCF